MLREHDVKVISFPSHTAHVFQALDLSLFSVLKRKMHSKLPRGNDDRVVAFIQKAFHSLKKGFVPDNVRNAFKMLGFEFSIAKSPYTLLIREEKLRGSHRFREFEIPTIRWTSYRRDVGMYDIAGLIRMSK
jgi:hypothetical protein